MLSAISQQGDISFEVTKGTVNSEVFTDFCRTLLNDVGGKKVFLILDRVPYHASGHTRKFAEATGGLLRLFFLPSYSPELNPDELVWKNVKHDHLGRASIKNGTELHSRAVAALENLREAPRARHELLSNASAGIHWQVISPEQAFFLEIGKNIDLSNPALQKMISLTDHYQPVPFATYFRWSSAALWRWSSSSVSGF